LRARCRIAGAVRAGEFPLHFEVMDASTDIRRDEVETVRGQGAEHQVQAAIVRYAAGRDVLEHVRAELLKPLIIDDARFG